MSKALTTDELIKKMAWHVSREVKHYKSDFDLDREALAEALSAGRYGQYIWITRTCGTYLVPVGIAATDPDRSAELLAAIRRTWSDAERREYCITLGPCSHSFQPLRQREARA